MLRGNERKYRTQILTIFQGAECWGTFQQTLNTMKGIYNYAFIKHDKDIDDETGEIKSIHYHLIIEYESARTLESTKKKFNGAHVEPSIDKKGAYQYLIHKNDKSKYQYDPKEIITKIPSLTKTYIDGQGGEIFNEFDIAKYIANKIFTPYQFMRTFGMDTYNKCWRAYREILQTYFDRSDGDLVNDVKIEENLQQANIFLTGDINEND